MKITELCAEATNRLAPIPFWETISNVNKLLLVMGYFLTGSVVVFFVIVFVFTLLHNLFDYIFKN